jgi:NADPH:quinone reductase-like Zn-dependent oxidoreductase
MARVPPTMRAALLRSFGGPDVLQVVRDAPTPRCGPNDVLVRVAAAAVNPLDARVRAGYGAALFRPTLPLVLGRDVSGEVVARGANARAFPLGASVFGALSPVTPRGSHAEYVAVNEAHLAGKPPNLSHAEAAALPFATLTAHRALFATASLAAGEKVLILGAGGSVGFAAAQLAAARGCDVYAACAAVDVERLLASGCVKGAWAFDGTPRAAGSTASLGRFAKENGWGSFDVALDAGPGTPSGERSAIRTLRRGVGRFVTLHGSLASLVGDQGPIAGGLSAGAELARRKILHRAQDDVGYHWAVMRQDADAMAEMAQLAGEEQLTARVARTFPLEDIAEAHRAVEDVNSNAQGKTVVEVWVGEGRSSGAV